ncbi:MAG: cysteine protease StiP family protein [Clostridiales bacterium]|jgi:hypothetical protein|nr:cysteine protease StiP family protein [Clostridiales bacterium]
MYNGTFRSEDVTLLLNNITGLIQPKPTEERERLIQSGVHYSEMLPMEYVPSDLYIREYERVLNDFSGETAEAVMAVSEKIYSEKRGLVILVSLARAGTPAGILIKRYLEKKYFIKIPHYTISIVRGRGIDENAMQFIIENHYAEEIQFVDGWTGKGAILDELSAAVTPFVGEQDKRKLLAVIADPANITDICGTHDDIPIASSFLNSTVCGLMSRTIIRPGIKPDEFHGVSFYKDLRGEDRTYEFIQRIEKYFTDAGLTGMDEVKEIAAHFKIGDINFIKPGIGEATRVLLRRVPDMVLIAENAEEKPVAHLVQLAKEKDVPIIRYPLRRYLACGIIKNLADS